MTRHLSTDAAALALLRGVGYQVLHTLGSGSGGQVYKALQPNTGQAVAVKLLSLDDGDSDVRERRLERFRREISICSRLYHPDIVRLLGSGELDDGRYFAVFEYIPGRTLAELLREEGMLTVKRARDLMLQLLPPLAYAHSNGIAHRDLKPSNIMVTSDGVRDRLKILDFGISVATRRDQADLHRLTLSHEWVGTPAYAAPEQLRGENANEKSDLYAWGLIFLECLTGSAVVRGSSLVEIIERQLHSNAHELPPALRQHRLGGLLSRVLEKDAHRRPNDANLLLSLLERIGSNDLEDAEGYLRDSARSEARKPARLSDTLTDELRPEAIERRQVSIVCVRTTWVTAGKSPSHEQLDAWLDDIDSLFLEVSRQFGGTHVQTLGEYAVMYFGLSPVRDRDSRLAVRAALELVNRLEKTANGFEGTGLQVQVGVHAASVALDRHAAPVGGVGARIAMQLAAIGGNAALRGSRILVSEPFRQLAARFADFEPYPMGLDMPRTLPLEPLTPFVLLGESDLGGSRPERSIFVGRQQELERLERCWQRSREAEGAAVLVTGEAGIGKSRLVAELMGRLLTHDTRLLEVRCLPEWQHSYMRPFSKLMLRELGARELDPEALSVRLEQAASSFGLERSLAVPVLASWLSLPLPPGYSPLAWSPQKQRQLLYQSVSDALIVLMERGAALWFEDVHWADASTLECIDVLLARARHRRTFIVMTARPETKPVDGLPLERIELQGLDPDSVKNMLQALQQGRAATPELLEQIADHSDGVPLYVEELAVAMSSYRQSLQSTAVDRTAPLALPVPASLRELLQSRFQDLGRAKQTAQFAAALGREFSFADLSTLAAEDEFSLLGDVEQLVSASLIAKRLRVGGPSYQFRHALLRDSVYDSMSEAARRVTHERIAQGLERRIPDVASQQPDLLAHHWERAGKPAPAARYWQLSAQKSSLASAHIEALAQVDRALQQIALLPESPDRARLEAELLLARGTTLVAKRGYTDPAAAQSFEAVTRLVPASGATLELSFMARWGLWYSHNTQGRLRQASDLADELRKLVDAGQHRPLSSSAWQALCLTSFCTGRLSEAVRASRACEAEYVFERDRHLATRRGDDPLLACLSFEALAELLIGRHHVAVERVESGLALAERLDYPSMRCGMHAQAAWMYLVYGSSGARRPDLRLALEHAALSKRKAAELGFPFWHALAELVEAAAGVVLGDREALVRLTQVAEVWRRSGAALGRCWHLTFMAHALRLAGEHAGAHEQLAEALDHCERSGSRFYEPEVRRELAELWLDADNPAHDQELAVRALDDARDAATKSGADWWALATALSRFRMSSTDTATARVGLASVLERFPVLAHEPPLVREARALLDSTRA